MLSRIFCAFFGHDLWSYRRHTVYKKRLAGKSKHHVKIKGQKQYLLLGEVELCYRCKEPMYKSVYNDN